MSYILDALKRADAERERGHVPGLHSQSTAAVTATPARQRRPRPGIALVGGACLLLLVAAAGWWLVAPNAQTPPPPAPTTPAAAPPPPTAPAALPPAPTLPILAPEPIPAAAPRPAREPAPPGRAAPASTGAQPGNVAAAASSTPEATAATTGSTNGNGNGAVRSFAELAPEIRAQLPQVSVSGSTYSGNPAHRMLIANGKVVHEGEEISPGLQLESIGPGKAVLNHRGTRYSIGY